MNVCDMLCVRVPFLHYCWLASWTAFDISSMTIRYATDKSIFTHAINNGWKEDGRSFWFRFGFRSHIQRPRSRSEY